MLDRLSRFAPLTGIAFAVLTLISIFSSNTSPSSSASGAHVLAFYAAHKSSQQASDFLLGIALIFFLCFIGSLYGLLRRSPGAQTLATLGLAGAVLFALGFALFAGIDFSLAQASRTLSPQAAQALNVLDDQLFLPAFVGAVVFGLAIGLAIVRSGLLPAWLGWVLLVVAIATGTPASFVGAIGLVVWTLVVSVLIYRRGEQPAGVEAVPQPAAT